MTELFPPDEAQRLHAAVKAYLAAARYRGWETVLRRTPRVEAPVVVEPWQVHALRSRLYLRDKERARKELEQAVALAPKPLPAGAAVLKVQLERGDAKELLASYPDAPEVLVAAHRTFDEELDRLNLDRALGAAGQDPELLLLAGNTALFA